MAYSPLSLETSFVRTDRNLEAEKANYEDMFGERSYGLMRNLKKYSGRLKRNEMIK